MLSKQKSEYTKNSYYFDIYKMVIKMEEIIREIVYICVMFIGIILYEVMSDKCLVCILDKPLFPDLFKKEWKREVIQDWLAVLFLFVFPGLFLSFGIAYIKIAILGIIVVYESKTLRRLKISQYVADKHFFRREEE